MKISKIRVIGNLLAILPGAYLLYRIIASSLSANPIQTATIITGRSAAYLLLFSLFCSPLHRYLKISSFLRLRKIAGVYSFYYSLVHFLIFAAVDYQFNIKWLAPEVSQKPFLIIGIIALILLFLLAITSFQTIKRKMGIWWKRTHILVYGIAGLILIHVALASKGDIIDPIILIGIYLVALLLRLPYLRNKSIQKIPIWARKLNSFLIEPF